MGNWFVGLASLLGAFFAGWISVKTTRKPPHDRLKQLAEIRKILEDLDQDKVIEAAIHRELRMLKRLNDAREVGRLRYAYEWTRQHLLLTATGASVGLYVSVFAMYQAVQSDLNMLQRLGVMIPASVLLLVTVAAYGIVARPYYRFATQLDTVFDVDLDDDNNEGPGQPLPRSQPKRGAFD